MARQIRGHKAPERWNLLDRAVREHAGHTVVVTHLREAGINVRVQTVCRLVAAAWPGVLMTHGSPLLVVQPVIRAGGAVVGSDIPLWIPSTYVLTIERKTP